jgi:8-oxo-dGTP pyrophosphatase MutT (NUDIX family)
MGTGARHSVSVAAIVVDEEGRILVTRRQDNGRWEPPGGVLELHEAPIDALKREVLEETGYEVDPDYLSGVYKNMTLDVVALVFRAHVVGGHSRTSAETSRVEWWPPQTITQHMEEAYAVRVLDALREEHLAMVRIHDGHAVINERAHNS